MHLVANRITSRSDHPRKYLSRENGAFRRKQSKPEETAQLLHELTNLANPVTSATTGVPATHNPEDSCRHSSTEFEFSGLGDCPELLADFLDARYENMHTYYACFHYIRMYVHACACNETCELRPLLGLP